MGWSPVNHCCDSRGKVSRNGGTSFSKGLSPDDTVFIRDGGSLRFAFAPLCLSYVAASIYGIRWFGVRRFLAGLSLITPALLVYKWNEAFTKPLEFEKFVFLTLGFMLVLRPLARPAEKTLSLWRSVSWPKVYKEGTAFVTCVMLVCVGALAFSSYLEAKRRAEWIPQMRIIWKYVWKKYPENYTIAVNPDAYFRYPLLGPTLSNKICLIEMDGDSIKVPEEADLVYLQHHHYYRRPNVGAIISQLEGRGWREMVNAAPPNWYVLLARRR